MGRQRLIAVAGGILVAAVLAGCSSDSSPNREERGTTALDECRGHGGVIAFDDDAIVCGDQSSSQERGMAAVDACRLHGGVSAFDDDIVICRDRTFHEAEGG